jgi:hypothetical protein
LRHTEAAGGGRRHDPSRGRDTKKLPTKRAMKLFAYDGVKATPSGEYDTSQEVFMSVCTVWELVLTLAVVVFAGFASH